ncbi:hypothetical protein BCR36DRAFT_411998 [Piromyces finnis]|uniref:Uncharacterized protein n=1 Tax=Piromyces finnis TaxID=1754191 RepID=A0A1Y1VBC1_9FUNG|nr:hypothetical protein BCR36DRAFT_411998 [Piromyces finnis]|eukprot:ORX51013.1 hypothetical protein BCR36DRAFT_411998 [Piromyces finnis]
MIEISDIFKFVSNKQLYKRGNSVIKGQYLDYILGKESDLEYYMKAFFENNNEKRKIPKFRSIFFEFGLNFYKICNHNFEDGKGKQVYSDSSDHHNFKDRRGKQAELYSDQYHSFDDASCSYNPN